MSYSLWNEVSSQNVGRSSGPVSCATKLGITKERTPHCVMQPCRRIKTATTLTVSCPKFADSTGRIDILLLLSKSKFYSEGNKM